MKILAIDYGRRFLGLAFVSFRPSQSNPALPLPALRFESPKQILALLFSVCKEYQIDELIFGVPHSRKGQESGLAPEIRQFAKSLVAATGISQCHFIDESLTSFAAGQKVTGVKKSKKRAAENSLAAQLILENFLSSLKD